MFNKGPAFLGPIEALLERSPVDGLLVRSVFVSSAGERFPLSGSTGALRSSFPDFNQQREVVFAEPGPSFDINIAKSFRKR